jgi:hypothetical protein
MDEKPSFRPFILPTIILAVAGWGTLILLLNLTVPTLWPRWWFFALLVLAVTGTALPLTYFLNRLFGGNSPAGRRAIVREALWVGVYFAALAWLSMGRVLTISIATWIAVGFGVIEYLIRMRENTVRAQRPIPGDSAKGNP